MELLLYSFTAFWIYCVYAWLTVGIKSSISDTYFHVRFPNLTFRLFFSGGISLPIAFYASSGSPILLVSALFIFGMVIVPGKKGDDKHNINHGTMATGGIILGYLYFIISHIIAKKEFIFIAPVLLFALLTFLSYPIKKLNKKGIRDHTTWIEVYAYNIIVITLIIYERLT